MSCVSRVRLRIRNGRLSQEPVDGRRHVDPQRAPIDQGSLGVGAEQHRSPAEATPQGLVCPTPGATLTFVDRGHNGEVARCVDELVPAHRGTDREACVGVYGREDQPLLVGDDLAQSSLTDRPSDALSQHGKNKAA